MTDPKDIDVVDAELEVVESGGVVLTTTSAVDLITTGTAFAIRLDVPEALYLYVLQLSEDDDVAVIYPPAGASQAREKVASGVRYPADGFFTAEIDGSARAVLSKVIVPEDDWVELLDGRDPAPQKHTSSTG